MAFPVNSAVYGQNIISSLAAPTTAAMAITGAGRMYVALYTDSTFSQVPTGGSTAGYSTTSEHTSSGTPGADGYGYTPGGAALAGMALTMSSGLLVYTANILTWTAVVLSNVRGCVIYDNVATFPVAKPCLAAVRFSGLGSSGGGDFTIDWSNTPSTNTIFTIDPA